MKTAIAINEGQSHTRLLKIGADGVDVQLAINGTFDLRSKTTFIVAETANRRMWVPSTIVS